MEKLFKPVPIILFTLLILFCTSCEIFFNGNNNWSSMEITRVVIREKAGETTYNYPLTFGHVFRRGDVPAGYSIGINSGGTSLESQADIKSTYPDGSVRHAVISLLIPQVTAFADVTLSLVRSSGSNGQGMNKAAILETDIGAILNLTGLSGSGNGGDLTADLREAISQTEQLEYWLRGDICTEILVRQDLNPSLNALWEVRFYPASSGSDSAGSDSTGGDTTYIRISHTIENININSRGNVDYALSIYQGNANPGQVYEKDNFQHNQASRWRRVFWLGEEPPEVEIRFDLPYMISTGMILPYDTSLEINESAIASNYTAWRNSNRDIMGNGSIYRYMPGVGGRGDIGMLPKWTAMYLLSMDNRMREIMLGNGEMSGSVPIHYREDNSGLNFYGRTVSIDDRPNFNWINANVPAIGSTTTDWHPDRAHQPSLAYIPYLITGEKWFLDELYYWAGYNVFFAGYHRNGRGFNGTNYDGSFGLVEGDLRACAWALRTISEAATIAPNTDPEKDYFRQKIINNLEWFLWRNDPAGAGHGLHSFIWPSYAGGGRPAGWPDGYLTSPWQHDFMVLVLADMVRKLPDLNDAVTLRDWGGSFTVNRFIRLPQYAGVAYRMPLSDRSNTFYKDASWERYAADIIDYTNNANPETYFRSQNYAYSYAYIAMGASAVVSHLNGGLGVYNFLRNNVSYDKDAPNDPTWAFVPLR